MDIIGTGFLARNLRQISERHPGVVALAAGVSDVGRWSPAGEFRREEELVTGTAAACRRDGRKLLLFSTASAALYGAPGCSGSEHCAHSPRTPYGGHKREMERIVRESGCAWLILRLSHVVGNDQSSHQLVPTLVRQIAEGRVRIFRDSNRDILDIRDFVRSVDSLLELELSHEIVNIASGASVPVESIVTHIAGMLGTNPRREYVTRDSGHRVSVRKFGALVPERGVRDPERYYKAVLDRYVPHYAHH